MWVCGAALLPAVVATACGGSAGRRVAARPEGPAAASGEPAPPSTAAPTTAAPTTVAMTSPTTPAPAAAPAEAAVAVAVATVWSSPRSPRAVDAPALGDPVDIRRWISSMTVAEQRDLQGRTQTQVLLGDTVLITGTEGDWVHVVVPDQPTPKDARGYPGWIPRRQLSFAPRPAAAHEATVVVPLTRLLDPGTSAPGIEVSFGTRLPVDDNNSDSDNGSDSGTVLVITPQGARARLDRRSVSVTAAGQPALPPSGASLVDTARSFQGTPYLWAGASGFAFDCSGLTHLDYRVHGMRIPRDAQDQAAAGQAVTRPAAAPGDLYFYARNGVVHHVAMVVDGRTIVQAPAAGEVVEVVVADAPPRPAEFSGARRFLR